MGFIPILALCAALNGEPDMNRCVFVDDTSHAFETETGCAVRANIMKDTDHIRQEAANILYAEYGYTGQQGYSLWCIPQDEMRQFYQSVGMPYDELGDIPDDT